MQILSLLLVFAPIIMPFARLFRKSILQLSGPDAQKFLKGQSCKDVEALGGGYSGFLNASVSVALDQKIRCLDATETNQGRVLHTVFIFCLPDRYLIAHESPPNHPAPLAKLLPPFKLRSKVRFADVTDEWDAWAAWGDGHDPQPAPMANWRMGSGGAAERLWTWPNGRAEIDGVGTWDLRAGLGKQLLLPKGKRPEGEVVDEEQYHLRRMLLGVPEGPEVIPGSALPLESCMDVHGGGEYNTDYTTKCLVDFRKGCYLGQELTVRTYHTGATRKRILPLRLFSMAGLDTPALNGTGQDILFHPGPDATTKRPKAAGRVLSQINSVGLGLVRLEMVDKSWQREVRSMEDWHNGPRLTVEVGGETFGVKVGHGEAYGASLAHQTE